MLVNDPSFNFMALESLLSNLQPRPYFSPRLVGDLTKIKCLISFKINHLVNFKGYYLLRKADETCDDVLNLANDSKGNMQCNAIFPFDQTYFKGRNKKFLKVERKKQQTLFIHTK